MMPLQFSQPDQQLTLDYMESFIALKENRYAATCDQVQLRSHFQPIYSLAHQRIVGYEGLIRPSLADGIPISPLMLFSEASSLAQSVFIDRLCRTLHVSNFMQQAGDETWLFLNLNPLTTVHGKQFGPFFNELLQRYNIPPHRIVIEILEGQIQDESQLADAIHYYRDMGCLIAIDDFGVGHSNFNRIWNLSPHIVKLDKTLIDQAACSSRVRRILPGLTSLIHQAGSLALIEGIETEEQALIALQSDIDFVQGFFFARPESQLPKSPFHPVIGELFAKLKHDSQLEDDASQVKLVPYTNSFFEAAIGIRSGETPLQALQHFLAQPWVKRCYLLDELGKQVGQNFLPDSSHAHMDPRFAPLDDASDGIWARRHYYQQAIAEPGRVQVSKPYLSITGGALCITLSIAISTLNGLRVLCGDIATPG
ncbi:MAG TPA: EAL domain-containing protein [Pseudomonadales bacterium]|nr:EAL domain-containing protein [Pseudomonadales bacterium]